MSNPDPLESFQRRAVRHAFEDGAIDLVLGIFTLTVGVATQRRAFLALAIVYLGAMTIVWRFLHEQLTSRRTGYAELPGDPPRQLLSVTLLAGCLTMGVVAAITLTSGRLWGLDRWPAWATVLAGLILAGGSCTQRCGQASPASTSTLQPASGPAFSSGCTRSGRASTRATG